MGSANERQCTLKHRLSLVEPKPSMIHDPGATVPFGATYRPVNTFRPRQNGRQFPDDNFKRIFWNKNI